MYEVEVKVRADHDAVRSALERLEATRVGTVEQADVYYDVPHRNFAETDEALRIRREVDAAGESETVLTYKGPLVEDDSKTREEIETPIVELPTFEAILDSLGFEPAATVEKTRERWEVDDYVVSLDDVAGLGGFVEVEAEAEREAVSSVRDGAYEVLRRLDLDPESQIRTSYLGLLLEDDG
ncbi:Adenylate cyclase, class 2 (thermophilic) [Halanaeroarchaeum sp. HSR-CO]|uniref:class IV adenylate cyclase n=1 Tax=Halanaeroarchaeum sp. HSR-CO TaxID=2866382 RepID=UPI00217E7036|nr:class IV adenylate cyclase [Halanaeroarchaeum sp. HSR-CO]UWG48389.1 Adenylate cyclase, class 2 (thermophilic) [Halanaeroarchaeum sp. HSR-CO]